MECLPSDEIHAGLDAGNDLVVYFLQFLSPHLPAGEYPIPCKGEPLNAVLPVVALESAQGKLFAFQADKAPGIRRG
jgi:hypothetical protein